MADDPKPLFRPARGLWYVQIDGKQQNLGPDEAVAFTAYHALMQQRDQAPKPGIAQAAELRVVVVIDGFLDWCQKNRAPDTYIWYRGRLVSFCKTIDAGMTVDRLKPYHVQIRVDA